jgi:hypothetical protein
MNTFFHPFRSISKQKVVGRTHGLLSFNTTWTKYRTTSPKFIRCRGNVFTELLLSNDREVHLTEPLSSNVRRDRHAATQINGRDFLIKPLIWAQMPWYTYQVSLRLVQAFKIKSGKIEDTDTRTEWKRHKLNFIFQNKQGRLKILLNEELLHLHSSPIIIKMIKSMRMRWAGNVAWIMEEKNKKTNRKAYRILVGKSKEKRPLGRPRRRCE